MTGTGASPLAAPAFVRFYLLLNEARPNARFRKKKTIGCLDIAIVALLEREANLIVPLNIDPSVSRQASNNFT